MAILSPVEAKSFKGRLIHAAIILLLTVGGATMVYPFVIMISGSLRSEIDASELTVVPRYLIDDQELYRKFLETKYGQDILALGRSHGLNAYSFATVPPPAAASPEAVQALRDFLVRPDLPRHWKVLGGLDFVDTTPEGLRQFRNTLKHRYRDDIEAYARDAGAAPGGWLGITIWVPNWTDRRFNYADEPIWQTYFDMVEEAKPHELYLPSVTGHFLDAMVYPVYGRIDPAMYNADHTEKLERFTDFRLPATPPGEDQPALRRAWIEFATDVLNPSFIVARGVDPARFRDWLADRYDTVDGLNQEWGRTYAGFDDVDLPDGRRWLQGPDRRDYKDFLATLGPESLQIVGPEFAWRDFAVQRGLAASPDEAPPVPIDQLEYDYVQANTGSLRWDYAVRNYVNVWDELVLEGRALTNTVIYCALAIISALLINPLAAYGLSRYQLPGTYKFLLILMATMAFPPMVALLPQYILLRHFNLMNTFVALLLPLAANGYLIFLLKGFFDSLPRELYEAARIDGAGEVRMFFQITMALSKPILAVLALGTFTSAYAAFLYPLLVAPDEDMWLIAVWLYQFQQRASSGAVYASVILASIPTLLIFIFVQRTIMRGIIVPTEK